MAEFGITRVPVDYFHFRNFRYISLNDALTQIKRTDRDEAPIADGAIARGNDRFVA